MSLSSRSAAVLAAIVVAAGGIAVAQSSSEPEAGPQPSPSPSPAPHETSASPSPTPQDSPASPGASPTSPQPAEGDLREVIDEGAGFAISFPAEWPVITSVEETMRLAVSAGGSNAFWIRAMPIPRLADSLADQQALASISVESMEDLAQVRSLTDRIVTEADTTERVIQGPIQTTVGNLPTLAYVYHFTDPAQEDVVGVHAHYFAFLAQRVYIIVMQALPREEFDAQTEATFGRIIDSFRLIEPDPLPEG